MLLMNGKWQSSHPTTLLTNYQPISITCVPCKSLQRIVVTSGKSGPKDQVAIHYYYSLLRLRIGARLTRYRNYKFHNFARTISRHADGISRYSVPPSAGPCTFTPGCHQIYEHLVRNNMTCCEEHEFIAKKSRPTCTKYMYWHRATRGPSILR